MDDCKVYSERLDSLAEAVVVLQEVSLKPGVELNPAKCAATNIVNGNMVLV